MSIQDQAVIYHNPRCSKSRQTLALLHEHGVKVEEVRYLDHPPSKADLALLCQMLDIKPQALIRTGEKCFKELGLSKQDDRSDEEWLEIMSHNPKLIERPIVKIANRAVIGRPPENVLTII